jgi:hypothetical protein
MRKWKRKMDNVESIEVGPIIEKNSEEIVKS